MVNNDEDEVDQSTDFFCPNFFEPVIIIPGSNHLLKIFKATIACGLKYPRFFMLDS